MRSRKLKRGNKIQGGGGVEKIWNNLQNPSTFEKFQTAATELQKWYELGTYTEERTNITMTMHTFDCWARRNKAGRKNNKLRLEFNEFAKTLPDREQKLNQICKLSQELIQDKNEYIEKVISYYDTNKDKMKLHSEGMRKDCTD